MSKTARLSRDWRIFLCIALFAGALLRLLFVQDMEYKEDEEYNFTQSQGAAAWSWIGMPSGVYIPNPGMSVWVFKILAALAHASEPTQLARAVQLFALIGICAILPFVLKALRPSDDRTPWLWAMALALVNPFAVFYQRKLWPEPILPFFSMMMLAGWWRRDLWLGAFAWGLLGAALGQIHMSGFFFAAAFPLFTLIFESVDVPRSRVRWSGWLGGSILGSLPLIPWALYSLQNPVHEAITRGWQEAIQAKFWVFWMTDPLGLHLGNTLGILRGPTNWDQVSDFVRYPLIGGHATYLNLAAHLIAALAAGAILIPALLMAFARTRGPGKKNRTETQLALMAGIWGFGLLLTASSVMIRRYYLMVSFPLEFVWLARLALQNPRPGFAHRCLATLWGAELFISACFVGYVHVNEGSTTGDYGDAYHVVMENRENREHRENREAGARATPPPSPAPSPR